MRERRLGCAAVAPAAVAVAAARPNVPDLAEPLADVQSLPDHRNVELMKVGIRSIRYPIRVLDRSRGRQSTVASVHMYVNLPREAKGTHMSRFVELLNEHAGEIAIEQVPHILRQMRARLEAERAYVEIAFPYFIRKRAPVSGAEGLMEYECTLRGEATDKVDIGLEVKVPVTTLCPCSKEISDVGAHNQRALVRVALRFRELVWIEDVVTLVEACASSEVYSVLKRVDEKYVTERAYAHPVFVEDLVREVAVRLRADDNIRWFAVESESLESIHNHNAYAYVEWTRPAPGESAG